MSTDLWQVQGRWARTIVLAMLLTLVGLSAPMLAESIGLSLADVVQACQSSGSGCG